MVPISFYSSLEFESWKDLYSFMIDFNLSLNSILFCAKIERMDYPFKGIHWEGLDKGISTEISRFLSFHCSNKVFTEIS